MGGIQRRKEEQCYFHHKEGEYALVREVERRFIVERRYMVETIRRVLQMGRVIGKKENGETTTKIVVNFTVRRGLDCIIITSFKRT